MNQPSNSSLRKSFPFLLLFLAFGPFSFCQNEKTALSFDDYDIWKRIQSAQISNNGEFVVYHETPGKGDVVMRAVSMDGEEMIALDRTEDAVISFDSRYVSFRIKPSLDTVQMLQRRNTPKKKMPKDTLGIFHVDSNHLVRISNVRSFAFPDEWNDYLVYFIDDFEQAEEADSLSKGSNKSKEVNEDNGYHLIVRHLPSETEDTLYYVLNYTMAAEEKVLLYHTSGRDSLSGPGVYIYHPESKDHKRLASGDLQIEQLCLSEDGKQAAFLAYPSDPKSYQTDFRLRYWNTDSDSSTVVITKENTNPGWLINPHQEVRFSENGTKLFFHTYPAPMIKDTSLLEEEKIQVEVWTYKDQRLYTQQNVQKENDRKKGYLAVFHPKSQQFAQLGDLKMPDVSLGQNEDGNYEYAWGANSDPYMMNISWEGFPGRKDVYLVDQNTGNRTMVKEALLGNGDISPGCSFLYWYDNIDTSYYSYEIASGEVRNISNHIPTSITDELDDHPDYPPTYGLAGWAEDDNYVFIYDRYDIWQVDPRSPSVPKRLTMGRESHQRYRVRKLDPDRHHLDFTMDLLHTFNERTRDESFSRLDPVSGAKILLTASSRLRVLSKARDADRLIYTMEDHTRFPDIRSTDLSFSFSSVLSEANPQQINRKWSTVEMVNWTSLDGIPLEGLLYKPENFDPAAKYPMIVYFYERNADNVHRYWGAFPHRSIVNPSFYASRGYLIFIPDIVYRDGYPGPSCYNAVIPGVTHLIDRGYVDVDRIGMQGHSWGGYQTAYLATRTNLFACAESGAPVANMISAYGGIRWGTGLSRMFQYEHTQSRIGGSLWEYPLRYVENSPIFFADKINTPILIMHNDHDTAVPWYQGIELFVALRRLGKPVWMLNYNDEPHWPTKRENIVDFNIRMQQYFDHYLMGGEMPEWMKTGVPALEKGYNKGY